jgi:hypothetical protein
LLVQLALVVSVGLNVLTILVLANQRRKVNVVMTANKDALDGLQSDLQNESSAVDSAVVLINGLANRLTEILSQNSSPEDLTAEIQALRDQVNALAAGTAAENDSSNFPSTPASSGDNSGAPAGTTTTQSNPPSDSTSSDQSTAGTSSDTSSQSGDSTPASSDVGSDVSAPSGDGTADVNPPSDSPAGASDGSVVPDGGSAVADESTTTDSPPSE